MLGTSTRRLTGTKLTLLFAVAFGAAIAAQAADPLMGTWNLDAAKSSYKPGPTPKSATVVISGGGKEVKVAVDAVMPDGTPMKWGYTSTRDGEDVPVTGHPAYETANVTRTSPSESTIVYKKGGKMVATTKTSVAKDGATMTAATTGTDAKGQPMNNLGVYSRK
jgi:hypothetical protein